MKQRILISAIAAIAIHAILFGANFNLTQGIKLLPETHVMEMTFAAPKEKSSASQHKNIDIKIKKTQHDKISVQAQPEEKNKGAKSTDAIEAVSVVHKAKPMTFSNKPPPYPRIARMRGYQGTVLLHVHVNKNGTVTKLKILKSSGYWILDKSALTSVKNWVFEPGTDRNKKVDMWVEQPVRFQLR